MPKDQLAYTQTNQYFSNLVNAEKKEKVLMLQPDQEEEEDYLDKVRR